jgi:hypothetical protein
MPGQTFFPGEVKIRPGVYVRTIGEGRAAPALPAGIVAAVFRSSWGPLATPTVIESPQEFDDVFGSVGTPDTGQEAFSGSARRVLAFRLGTGGVHSTLDLADTTGSPVNVVALTARYPGVGGNSLSVTVRDSLADSTKRELLIYDGTQLVETWTFTKGASGIGEPQALVNAIGGASTYVSASKTADGTKILAAVTQSAVTGGTDPTVVNGDYSTAFTALEPEDWNVLVTDSESASIHASVETYIARVRNDGKRVMAVVGEPPSVSLATRESDATALNNEAIVYVGNGFIGTDGNTRDGYQAAARVAGMIAGSAITDSLTHRPVQNATDVAGKLKNFEIEAVIQAGALVFTSSASGAPMIEYGITSLVTPSATQDDGWKKIRRVRTRDDLINRIVATLDPLVGQIPNSPDGRAAVVSIMQGIIVEMVREAALLDGTAAVDPDRAPAGDTGYFTLTIDDLDSLEKAYLTFGFRFSPPATTAA